MSKVNSTHYVALEAALAAMRNHPIIGTIFGDSVTPLPVEEGGSQVCGVTRSVRRRCYHLLSLVELFAPSLIWPISIFAIFCADGTRCHTAVTCVGLRSPMVMLTNAWACSSGRMR